MTAITAGRHRRARLATAAAPVARPAGVARIWRIGCVLLALQLAGFLIWSTLLYHRFALTIDYAQYEQAWYLIAHGHLDPRDIGNGYFWQNNSEFIIWPLALLYWVLPFGCTLLWIQDACVVAAELIALAWMCQIARRHDQGAASAWPPACGLALLIVNPWIWWSISFDFHIETLAIPLLVLLAWDMSRGRRRCMVWVIPLLACGNVADSYLISVGAAGVIAGPWAVRRRAAVVAGAGFAAVVLIDLFHGNLGSGVNGYAYLAGGTVATASPGLLALLKGIANHPLILMRTLWLKRADIWANLGSAGAIGIGLIWLAPVICAVLLENTLAPGLLFAMPSFQSLPVYLLAPVGTVALLVRLSRRSTEAAVAVSALVLVQAAGISAVWWPQVPGHWLRVPASSASTLSAVSAQIPGTATVVASEGIVGRFADRLHAAALVEPGSLAVAGPSWFVIAPSAGIEVQSTGSAMAFIAELAGPLHASLVRHANGVWAFRWSPPTDVRSVQVPNQPDSLPAWTSPGAAGRDVLTGPATGWHAAATGGPGYVTDGLQWLDQRGTYQATVSLAATGTINVEVWNDNCGTLLARRSVPATNGVAVVTVPVGVTRTCSGESSSGWGPFRADFLAPPAGQRLEIRVWSPGHEQVSVYTASLVRAG